MRFGLRNTLVAGSGILSGSYVLLLMVEQLPKDLQVAGWFTAISFLYFGAALVTVCGLPYLSTITKPEERSRALAVNGAMIALAGVLGNLLAGFLPGWFATITGSSLDQAQPYRISLLLIPIILILTALLQSRMQAEKKTVVDNQAGSSAVVPLGIFLFFGAVVFLQSASEGGLRAFFNVYLDQDLGVTTAAIGMLFSISGLVNVLGSLFMPALVSRLGTGAAFGLVSATGAAALVLIGAAPNFLLAGVGFIATGLIFSIGGAVRGLLSQEIVQPFWRSATSAILMMGFALGWAGMALLGSAIIGVVRFNGLMFIGAGSSLVSVFLIFAYLRTSKRVTAVQPAVADNG
jgi:MFS family permease